MKTNKQVQPPRWILVFFRWFCDPRFQEELEGDLLERFDRRGLNKSGFQNRLLLIVDVLTLFRPQLMGNFHHLTANRLSSMKNLYANLPEFYFLAVIFLLGYKPPFGLSTLTMILMAIVFVLIIFKNKVVWSIIAGLFIIVNLYMIGALISEFSEFPSFVTGAQQLILAGTVIIFVNIAMGGVLLIKQDRALRKYMPFVIGLTTLAIYSMASLAFSRRFPEHATSNILLYTGVSLLALCVGLLFYNSKPRAQLNRKLHVITERDNTN